MAIQTKAPIDLGPKAGWCTGADLNSILAWQPRMGVLIQRITHCDDADAPLYDQPIICEGVGAVTIPVTPDGKIGLQKQWRPCINPDHLQEYLKLMRSNKEHRSNPQEIPGFMFGRASWETPRGFYDFGTDVTSADTAARETAEEVDHFVASLLKLGQIIPTTTFTAQPTDAYAVTFDFSFSQKPVELPDPTERFLSRIKWFDLEGIQELQSIGELFCGFTLSIIQLLCLKDPEWATEFYGGVAKKKFRPS